MDLPSTSSHPTPSYRADGMQTTPAASGSTSDLAFRSPRSNKVAYSDRFIPSRAASARLDYSVLEREAAASQTPKRATEKEDNTGAYNFLLRSELLGCPGPSSPEKATSTTAPQGSPTKSPRKLFRYIAGDAENPIAGLPTRSPYARGPIGDDSMAAAALPSASRLPRKIPRTPFKVLDAPALADDFYLNLVDWSAQNVLAVGLGSCVYLWSACTSKVTRLVELPEGASVCSVGWSQRGTYLSVGTDKGEVQVWDATKTKK